VTAATPPAKKPAARKPAPAAKPRKFKAAALNDFPAKLPSERFEVIFDVGANVGQSALEFAAAYPEADVWAFEPVTAAFDALVTATAALPAVRPVQTAMGALEGSAIMRSDGTSAGNKLLSGGAVAPGREEVAVVTGDAFCEENEVERIGFLKIDTVGHDLQVLRGFHHMLGGELVDVLQVEAAMYRDSTRVPLERLRGYLEPLGYQVFGIYGQARGHAGMPVLTRMDVVFVSPATIERNTTAR
jgi:FkbM family methyltransferase